MRIALFPELRLQFRILLLVCLALMGNKYYSQNTEIDSLKTILITAKLDTHKVVILDKIAFAMLYENSDTSRMYAEQALQLSKQLNYQRGIGAAYKSVATATFLNGDYVLSMDNYLKALNVFEETKDFEMIAKTWGNIALIKFRQKNFPEALADLNRSIRLKEEGNFHSGLANNYLTLASIYYYEQSFDSAIENFIKASDLSAESGDAHIQSAAYNGVASIYLKKEDYGKALEYYYLALEILTEANDFSKGICGIRQNISRVYREMGDFDKALIELNISLMGAESIGSKEDIKQAYSAFDETYKQMGDTAKAYVYLELFTTYKDSVLSENVHNEINALQAKYDAEKKDQEISNLTFEKEAIRDKSLLDRVILFSSIMLLMFIIIVVILYYRQRRIADSKRKVELEQMALRSQMNPHFIFNSLNSIQRMFIEGNQDLAVDYVGDFGSLLRIILENSGKSSISLKDEIETLKLYIDLENRRTDGMIDYRIEIDENIDQLNNFVPPLIIQPFVENAIWHGIIPKGDKGLIQVIIRRKTSDLLICTILDDGIGIEKSQAQKKNSIHKSKGMNITQERLGKRNGVVIEELPAGGTKIEVIIPIQR